MTHIELNEKITKNISELSLDIEKYVMENAKFKIGDVVTSRLSGTGVFVICQIGFDSDNSGSGNGICYYGRKITKSNGEISNFSMDCDFGTPERLIEKTVLKVKNKEISFFKDHNSFENNIKIGIFKLRI